MGILLIRTTLGIYCCNFSQNYVMKVGLGGKTIESYLIIPKAYPALDRLFIFKYNEGRKMWKHEQE